MAAVIPERSVAESLSSRLRRRNRGGRFHRVLSDRTRSPDGNVDTLSLWDAHSTVQRQTADAIARLWSLRSPGDAVLDFGAGDGALLARIAQQHAGLREVAVVDRDPQAREAARARLSAVAPFASYAELPTTRRFDLVLAAHVLYFVGDVPAWWRSVAAILRTHGLVTVAITSPECDMYALRHIVRRHEGRRARFGHDLLVRGAAAVGLGPRTDRVDSSFSYPCQDPRLARIPAHSADAGLARLVCWLTALDPERRLPEPLQADINAFLVAHTRDGRLSFRIVDSVVHFSPVKG
ncbi:class I SAM-dependent methyltransferase [Solirubrobacter phytolaccae]|uniref:Class I SAM-dependent methyltransferase n=1 Tax=Solirubrobacter phytolaccae TaxID=1404360 RepID=A0A9X3NEY0_9ACTN|nr:methyltransferase domain-containing protein [Solirubrobacter phytolaccae]MDA0185263.1 class I SAM-dependent methyltransferase [Solirubrobacter phytolaccae]